MDRSTILLIGNHRLICESLVNVIECKTSFNAIAQTITNGKMLHTYVIFKASVVLIDMNIGEILGIKLIKRILQMIPSIKVIAILGSPDTILLKKLIALNVKGLITLTAILKEFLEVVNEVSNGRNYASNELREVMLEFLNSADIDSEWMSEKENQILYYMNQGLSAKVISQRLNIKLRTVEMHRYNILKKLRLPNAAALLNLIRKPNSHASKGITAVARTSEVLHYCPLCQ